MTREQLPDRRPCVNFEVRHGAFVFTLGVGMALDGRSLEVFADGLKEGTDLKHTISDACVVISLALQFGCPPELLPHSMGRVPDPAVGGCQPASILGAIATAVAEAAQHG